jgi:hypothetical protein
MDTNIIIEEDLNYLAQQSSGNLNMILAEMTTLMEENDDMVSLIENQNWFQRMTKTISGKNKMTQAEIEQNHDKINLYISQAMGELFNRNCIDHEIILGLGNKINELYDSQIEIKMIIGAFAQKLNQKIESIDNFHMLIEEINQGVYSVSNSFFAISRIMSQLDIRTVNDQRKMDILIRALEEHNILNQQDVLFSEMLEELLVLDENDAGVLAMFFGSIRNEYVAEITEKVIYSYYVLPEKTRKMKSKHSIIESVLKTNDIDLDYAISSHEICMTLIEAYANNIVQVEIEDKKNEEEEKKQNIRKYTDDAIKILKLIDNMTKSWNIEDGELYTHEARKKNSDFVLNALDNIRENSYVGKSIVDSLNNMTYFAQRIFTKYPELKIDKVELSKEKDDYYRVNINAALNWEDNVYKTVAEYYKDYISSDFINNSNFSLDCWDRNAEKTSRYVGYEFVLMSTLYMYAYIKLYNKIFESILERIDDSDFLNEVSNMIQKFPVEYNLDFENILVRHIETEHCEPHIEIEYNTGLWGIKKSALGYASLGWLCLKDYETTVILLKFKNMKIKNYTVNYKIIENEYSELDLSSNETYKYIDVEWGEWVDKDVLELKISKNNSSKFGTFKIKITIKEDSDVEAYICN